MASRTPLACLVILAAIVATLSFAPVALAGNICTASTNSCDPISITKSGPSYVNAGDPATYTFTLYNNTGFDTFSDVSVVDDQCAPMSAPQGDTNGNGQLDSDETW